jgi:hypothetical protein
MAHPSFQVGKFRVLGRYEIHFGKDGEGFFFYEIEDLETLSMVDVKDGLTEGEFLEAVGCAMNPMEFFVFQKLIHSIA